MSIIRLSSGWFRNHMVCGRGFRKIHCILGFLLIFFFFEFSPRKNLKFPRKHEIFLKIFQYFQKTLLRMTISRALVAGWHNQTVRKPRKFPCHQSPCSKRNPVISKKAYFRDTARNKDIDFPFLAVVSHLRSGIVLSGKFSVGKTSVNIKKILKSFLQKIA